MTTLKDIDARWRRANEGPWFVLAKKDVPRKDGFATVSAIASTGSGSVIYCETKGGTFPSDNAEAIANAPTDIKYLLGLVERARVVMTPYIQGRCSCLTHEGDPQEYRCQYCLAVKELLKDMESAKGGE